MKYGNSIIKYGINEKNYGNYVFMLDFTEKPYRKEVRLNVKQENKKLHGDKRNKTIIS